MAATQEIVAKEGNPELQGFLWQAKQAEVLVCDWVEFLGSAGGSTLTGLDVTINNEAGNKALQFMHDLIYELKITPEAVLTYDEEPSRQPFTSGNAVFLRNWSYVYTSPRTRRSPRSSTRCSSSRCRTSRGEELGSPWRLPIRRQCLEQASGRGIQAR